MRFVMLNMKKNIIDMKRQSILFIAMMISVVASAQENIEHGSLLRDDPIRDDRDLVADLLDHAHLVRDDDDREMHLLVDIADELEVITSLKAQGFNPEVNDETKTLCGEDAKFTEIKVSANGKEAFIVSALFEKNGVTYACTYKTSKAGANTGDFESIVNSISFR